MSATEKPSAASDDSVATHHLRRIAEILECPVEAFHDGSVSQRLAGGVELMRLWEAISDDAGRERLLVLARGLAVGAGAPVERAAE